MPSIFCSVYERFSGRRQLTDIIIKQIGLGQATGTSATIGVEEEKDAETIIEDRVRKFGLNSRAQREKSISVPEAHELPVRINAVGLNYQAKLVLEGGACQSIHN